MVESYVGLRCNVYFAYAAACLSISICFNQFYDLVPNRNALGREGITSLALGFRPL